MADEFGTCDTGTDTSTGLPYGETASAAEERLTEEQRRFMQSEIDRRVGQAQQRWERALRSRLEEAERAGQASVTERFQRETDELRRSLADAERRGRIADSRLRCLGDMKRRGIPAELVEFIACEDDADTDARLDLFETAMREMVRGEVARRFSAPPPRTGKSAPAMTREEFRELSLTERQELYRSNRELYDALC